MNKTFKAILAVCLALLVGIFAVLLTVLILPAQYDELYLGELADKYARLRGLAEENKIVVIGGSSVPFGIDSELMEEKLGLPTVDFGLYGPLGLPVMLDLTRGCLREGDVVVLAPETDEQMLSMSFNGEALWDCCDSDFTMLFRIRAHGWDELLGSFWTYAEKKLQFYKNGKPAAEGIYAHDSFDGYGDITYPRPASVMDEGYDTEIPVDLDPGIADTDFIDYVNEYFAWCESRGVRVYFSFPPMDELGVLQDDDGILTYATFLRESFNAPLISNITDYIMDAGYFYDTNYHMNDAGVIVHTARLIQDLENVIGDGSLIDIALPAPPAAEDAGASEEPGPAAPQGSGDAGSEDMTPAPEPTPEPTPEPVGSSRDAAYFTAEPWGDGLMVIGVTDEGRQQSELEIPWLIDGQKVLAIGQNCFDGCENLQTLYIQKNITRVMQGAFDGAPRLTAIHIDNEAGANILIPGTGLFDNTSGRLKVYVPQSAYGNFLADYFWGNYLDRLEAE